MESVPVEMRRIILEYFSNAELLRISLVNKLLNLEARTLLRDRANLIANLDCQNALPFVSALEKMKVVPFSGIKIHWDANKHRNMCPLPQKKLDPNSLAILDRVPWKSLSVEMDSGNYAPKRCPALQLVQKILQDSSEVLEQLELNNHKPLLQLIQQTIQDNRFPQLKILKLKGDNVQLFYASEGAKRMFVERMLTSAPNLQEFHQDNLADLYFLDSLFCGMYHEEWVELSKEDDEYLRAVHVVPVMPSFMCLRGLRKLKLAINHRYCRHHQTHPLFTKVTALIAFQRFPNLSINIRAPYNAAIKARDHLRPYASVELHQANPEEYAELSIIHCQP